MWKDVRAKKVDALKNTVSASNQVSSAPKTASACAAKITKIPTRGELF